MLFKGCNRVEILTLISFLNVDKKPSSLSLKLSTHIEAKFHGKTASKSALIKKGNGSRSDISLKRPNLRIVTTGRCAKVTKIQKFHFEEIRGI